MTHPIGVGNSVSTRPVYNAKWMQILYQYHAAAPPSVCVTLVRIGRSANVREFSLLVRNPSVASAISMVSPFWNICRLMSSPEVLRSQKTFGIRRLRARWNFWVQLCRKTALPGNETKMGVNFNTFLTFWAEMRRLRCFCLCVTGLCTQYRPRDSVIACRPCVIIVLRCTLARTPPNICDLASVLPVITAERKCSDNTALRMRSWMHELEVMQKIVVRLWSILIND